MATPASRARALALYRALLRSARNWPGPSVEHKYIFDESRISFRKNKGLSDPQAITKTLQDGETRLQLGWHYKIPYPRLHNLPTGTVAESPQRVVMPVYEVPFGLTADEDEDTSDSRNKQ